MRAAAIGLGVGSIAGVTIVGRSAGADAQRPMITNATVLEPTDPPTTPPSTRPPLPTVLPTVVFDAGDEPSPTTAPSTTLPTGESSTTAATTSPTTAGDDGSTTTALARESAGNEGVVPPQAVAAIDITSASVTCEGVIHVEYVTTVQPESRPVADHVVIFHPVGDPAAIEVAHVAGNVPNGSFVHERPGSTGETYRLNLIALFDPASVDGPTAMDQAETVPAADCY
jgi:hypothetical protein